jgi:hypothetical protein
MAITRVVAGPRPTAFSTGTDEFGTTSLVCQSGTVWIEGDLDDRRRVAEVLANAVGLQVVDTSRPVVLPDSAPRDRDHLRTT